MPRGGRRERGAGELEGQPDARSPPGDVVVEVAVEPLEACVEVGRQRHEQEFDVDGLEPEVPRQAAQPQFVPGRGGLVGGRLDAARAARRPRARRRACAAGEQPVDVLVEM